MRVLLDGAEPALATPDDFRHLSVVPARAGQDLAGALGDLGVVAADGGEVLLDAERLAGLGPDDPSWREGFAAMLRAAAAHGWVDAAGRIRAHVESPAD